MSERRQLSDSDKLPWLEPYREPKKPAPRPKKAAKPKPPAVAKSPAKPAPAPRRVFTTAGSSLALAGAAALALAGYWFGREAARPGPAPAGVTATLPAAEAPTKILAYPTIGDGEPEPPPQAEPRAEPPSAAHRGMRARPRFRLRASLFEKPPPPPPPAFPPAPVEQQAVAPVAIPPTQPPAPQPLALSPPPVPQPVPRPAPAAFAPRGTVALIGYYVSRPTAEAGYRRAKRRYPYIGRLTRIVTPVTLGRHTVYALRLAAGSAANARALCTYLHRVGTSCSVE